MAKNKIKTFPLTGGEDAISSNLQIPDGTARYLMNYEQNYDTGYSRIKGYRPLVGDGTLPGEGPVRGLTVVDKTAYLFQDKIGATEGGVWKAEVATYRVGSASNADDQALWGTNIQLTPGAWTELTNIFLPRPEPLIDVPGEAATLIPGGYYEFVNSNFRATVDNSGAYVGGYYDTVDAADGNNYTRLYGDICADDGTDGLGVTPLFGGEIGALYICQTRHSEKVNQANNPDLANWIPLLRQVESIGNSHDVSGETGRLYGVDGKNRAFELDTDTDTLVQINSGYDNDTPHHIESQGNRLCVGFRAGECAFSSVFTPHDFNAVNGAGSVGVQDWLTGMLAGPDGVLYIFCKDKTYLFKGLDGSLSDTELTKHSKDVGAYPYTGQALGEHTFFYDTWGLTSLEVTDKYGDVLTNSISTKIQPVLQGHQPIIAVVSRGKAQYKLYFRKPNESFKTTLLNATIIDGGSVGFTHSIYPFTITHASIGEWLGQDQSWSFSATEELHIAGVKELDTDGVTTVYKVYEMDVGNSFDGESYSSYLTLPFNFINSPHVVKKFRKMMVNVDTLDYTSLDYSVDFNFGANSDPKDTGGGLLKPSGDRWSGGIWDQFYWGTGYTQYAEGYINGIGHNLSVTLVSTSDRENPHTLKDISFIYQELRMEH